MENLREDRVAECAHGVAPLVTASTAERRVKGQDRINAHVPAHPSQPTVVVVCDGHCSSAAARMCVAEAQQQVFDRMASAGPAPPRDDLQGMHAYAAVVREALHNIFLDLNRKCFAERGGTTLTLAVVSGWLLTVANVGDSSAFLDNGIDFLEATTSDRLETNEGERERLQACSGARVARLHTETGCPLTDVTTGRGPLRVWPQDWRMGMNNSRSLGDALDGECILADPHMKQVLLPPTGARLIAATDGLWDVVSVGAVMRLSRSSGTDACATALAGIAASRMCCAETQVVPDDVSVAVVDFMPNVLTDFLGVVGASKPPAQAEQGGTGRTSKCGSLAKVIARLGRKSPGRKVPAPVSAWPEPAKPVPAVVLADVDCAHEGREAAAAAAAAAVAASCAAVDEAASRGPADEREAFRCDSAFTGDAEGSAALRKTLKDGLVTPEAVKGVRTPPRIHICKAEPALMQQYISGSLPFPVV